MTVIWGTSLACPDFIKEDPVYTIRESGEGDNARPTPQGDVPELSRRQAMKRLLEIDMAPIEVRVFRRFAPWHLRLRLHVARMLPSLQLFMVLVFAFQVVALSAADAARIMLQLQSPANRTHTSPPATGPRVFVIPSQPGEGPYGPFPRQPVWAPLNCCQTYVIPFAVPRIEVVRPRR